MSHDTFLLLINDNIITVINLDFLCAGAASKLPPLHITPSDQPTLSGLRGLWTT